MDSKSGCFVVSAKFADFFQTKLGYKAAFRWPDSKSKQLFVLLALVLFHALIWTAFASLGGNPALHRDSLEAYVWGREFQLGYYKHPPFWAWVAGAWFSVLPHTDWAFYLLSELNAALGIWGTWALLGRFTKGPERLAGTVLLLLTAFYTFNALRFNANTIQLSLWPWTMYWFVVSLQERTIRSGLALGLLAALDVLSKYYTVLLLLSCGVALLFHRERRAYLRCAAPWVAAFVFVVLVAPHFVWVVQHDYQPFLYAAEQTEHPKSNFAHTKFGFVLVCLLNQILPLGIVLVARFRQKAASSFVLPTAARENLSFLLVLALLPLGLTLAVSLAGYRVTPNYIIPACSLVPFMILCLIKGDARSVWRGGLVLYGLIVIGSLAAMPYMYHLAAGEPQPRQDIALAALDEWDSTTSQPLRLVAGSEPDAEAVTFYSPDDTSEFTEFNFSFAPWVSKKRIQEEGLLVVCRLEDAWCKERAAVYETSATRKIEKTIAPALGHFPSEKVSFTIIATPPAEAAR